MVKMLAWKEECFSNLARSSVDTARAIIVDDVTTFMTCDVTSIDMQLDMGRLVGI